MGRGCLKYGWLKWTQSDHTADRRPETVLSLNFIASEVDSERAGAFPEHFTLK